MGSGEIDEKLEMKVSLSFHKTPLPEVVEFLQSVTPVSFSIQREELPPDLAPITIETETSLRKVLTEITAQAGMSWEVCGDVVNIGKGTEA